MHKLHSSLFTLHSSLFTTLSLLFQLTPDQKSSSSHCSRRVIILLHSYYFSRATAASRQSFESRPIITAIMATFLPHQTASRPLPDFMPSSPPDQAIFNNLPQQTIPTQTANGNTIQHRQSTDFRPNGAAAYTNGHGAMPVPNGLPHQIPNGGSRHRGTMSLGAFDGPRSPPNTKSKAPHQSNKLAPSKTDILFSRRYFTCPLQILQDRTVPSGESLPLLTLDGYHNLRYAL